MRLATNHIGHTIERFDGRIVGWRSILDIPFARESTARAYFDGMPRTPGAEYRVAEALAERGGV